MKTKAFSLIEMLVVVGILAVVAVIALPSLFGGSHEADLNSATEQIVASARTAQNQAANQTKDAQWGIYFSNATSAAPFYAVFSGSSYASGTVQSVYRLPATIGFVSSTLPVGSSTTIIFSSISGIASASTTIRLYVLSQPSMSSTISIAQTGVVAYVTPTTPAYVFTSASSSGGSSGSTSNIWVLDQDHRIQEFSATGTYESGFTVAANNNNGVMAIDSAGNIWVGDSSGNLDEYSSNGTYEQDIALGSSYASAILGLTIDSSNNFWVAGEPNAGANVEEFSPTGTYIQTIGSYGTGSGQFEEPVDTTIDSSGNVWVTDAALCSIQEFSSNGTYEKKLSSTPYGCANPKVTAIDQNNNLWVTMPGLGITEYSATGTYVLTSYSRYGAGGSGNGDLNNPFGIAIDSNNNLWVADTDNYRVQEFSATGTYESKFGSKGTSTDEFEYPQIIVIH